MDYEKQIDLIRDLTEKVELGEVTILTGKNGSGKSLLRKMLPRRIADKTGKKDAAHVVSSISMESRSKKKYEFSALAALGIDDPTSPTGAESIHNIDNIFGNATVESPRYIVIDEPEIGMGEELVEALAIKLNDMFNPIPKNTYGIMVITHNRHLIKMIKGNFINLEGLSREEWLDRKIIPTDIKKFEDESLEFYRAINARIEKNEKSK